MKNENRIFELTHKGESKHRGCEDGCFIRLQRIQSNSAGYAMKHEGYAVQDITDTLSESEKLDAIEKDQFSPVVVTLIDPFTGMNKWIRVKLQDGTETTANTYAMLPQEGGGAGTLAIVKRSYIAK